MRSDIIVEDYEDYEESDWSEEEESLHDGKPGYCQSSQDCESCDWQDGCNYYIRKEKALGHDYSREGWG